MSCEVCHGSMIHGVCPHPNCSNYVSYDEHIADCKDCLIPEMEFKKDSKNESKPLMDELIPEFMLEMGKVLEYGRQKYGYRNWRQASEGELFHYRSAKLRHAFQEGEDKDTNVDHLVHEAVNCMFLWWFKYGK